MVVHSDRDIRNLDLARTLPGWQFQQTMKERDVLNKGAYCQRVVTSADKG